jgi:hypothetical protein
LDTQGGVVGPTGTVWTIDEDCSYAVARQIGFKDARADEARATDAGAGGALEELLDRLRSDATRSATGA